MAGSLNGIVVLIPGILGSRLQRDGQEVWGPSAGALFRGLWSRGETIRSLALTFDGAGKEKDDGVIATGLIPDIHLIPGLWKIEGYTSVRDTIVEYFKLEPDQFHEFPYDWRRDIRVVAADLREKVDTWLGAYRTRVGDPDAKLVLLAHSQGGLVSRYFLECLDGWRSAQALVTFGTPYQGSMNPVDFVSNGFKKSLGPIQLLDLTNVVRSLTSMYQMMPSYPCVDVGDGELYRVAEVPGTLPHIDKARAAAGLAFHSEIEEAVNTHMGEDRYMADRYATYPIVGSHQPTRQSARVNGDRLELLETHRDTDLDGDGTVPEVAATPLEYGRQPLAAFMRERHSQLQNWPAALDHVTSVLDRLDIRPGAFRAPVAAIGLDVDDAYVADEPIGVRITNKGEPASISVTLRDWDKHQVGKPSTFEHVGQDGVFAEFSPLPPGGYRVDVETQEGDPITDVFVVVGS